MNIQAAHSQTHSIGSIRALLIEIAARLEKLYRDHQPSAIDLNSLPFSPGEYEQLRIALGEGEVSARIDAIGNSEIMETQYSGVWWVTHYNVEGDIVADLLEINWLPEIVKSQPEDVREGLSRLQDRLAEVQDGT